MTHRLLRTALILALLAVLAIPAGAFFGSAEYTRLSELADGIASEMKESHAGKSLYLDKEDIRDSGDGLAYPFSAELVHELERALSKAGFGFEARTIARADLALAVSYRQTAESVSVYVKLKNFKQDSAYRALKGNYEISRPRLPGGSFAETLDNRIDRLAARVAAGWQRTTPLKLFVTPMVESRKKYSSPFAEYVTSKIKARLAGEATLRLVEERPVTAKVSSTRSIASAGSTPETGEAAFAGADALLESTYLRGARAVSVAVKVKGIDGSVKVFAEETIPEELIQHSMDNDAADTLATMADAENEQSGGMISIATTKGGRHQVYRDNEIVQFAVRTGKPLYLYVYDLNPKGEASLLFPKLGESEKPRLPGINHLIPDDSDSWEIRVEPPYGTDAVKVFACEKRLPLPRISNQTASKSFSGGVRSLKRVEVQAELAGQSAINARDLVDYYKGVAARVQAPLYESTVYVETRDK